MTEAEKVEWAASIAAVKARGPAPIFHQEAQKNLEYLQREGFNVVGYALEHCNGWTDSRRCTVDSKGLVRWIPSTDQEVAERAARQKAQEEVVALKERIARAGVEHHRALHEALQQEREACAQIVERNAAACDNHAMLRDVLMSNAAAIRARTT